MPAEPHLDIEKLKLIVDCLVAIGTIACAITAVFGSDIRSLRFRPEFSLSIRGPFKSPLKVRDGNKDIEVTAYLSMLNIRNIGNQDAKNVEVFVSGLEVELADGTFKKQEEFPALNLRWAHLNFTFADVIRPGMQRDCDFSVIVKREGLPPGCEWYNKKLSKVPGDTNLGFQFIFLPFTRDYVVGPGKYRLLGQVAAKNTKPKDFTLELNHTGHWFEDEQAMSSKGLGIL